MLKFNKVLSVLFLSISFNSLASDLDDDGFVDLIPMGEDGQPLEQPRDSEKVEQIIDEGNSSRAQLQGMITLGEKHFHAVLHCRRDLFSQTLSSLGGQPSYYALSEERGYENGIESKGPTLRGRLKTKVNKHLNSFELKFYPHTEGYDYDKEAKAGTELFVVQIPLNKFEATPNKKSSGVYGLIIERSDKSASPGLGQEFFYSSDPSINKIILNLEFKDNEMGTELLNFASRLLEMSKNVLSSAISYANSGFWGAFDYVYKKGVVPTLVDGIELVAKVADVKDGLTNIANSAASGTVLQDAKELVKGDGKKKVETFIGNSRAVIEAGNAVCKTHNQAQLIKEKEPLALTVQSSIVALDEAHQELLNLGSQKEALTKCLNDKDMDEAFLEGIKKEIGEVELRIKNGQMVVKVRGLEKEIAQLNYEIVGAEEEKQRELKASLSGKEKMLSIFCAASRSILEKKESE